MLGQLHIKNIGIIDDIIVNFDEHLNILTGETGAGKSLIIDSISSILGNRVTKDLIRTGENFAFVEACFFENDENIIIAREIYQNGRNICKINGKMVTLTELKEFGKKLIDLHGQHDNQSLLDDKTHIDLLDGFAGTKLYKLKEEYTKYYNQYKDINAKIKSNYGNEQERARRLDLLNYQIEEISSSNLKEDEEIQLQERRTLLLNGEKISTSLNKSYSILSSNVLDNISEITKYISNISTLNDKYNKLLESINDSYYNLQDVEETLRDYSYEIDFDENEQEQIEERLNLISNIKRKYGKTIKEVLEYYEKILKEKDFLENSEEIISKLKNEKSEIEIKLNKIAENISNLRKECAKKIESKINLELKDLEMKKAYLQFEFNTQDHFLENGKDEVKLLICTNLGDELKPLSKIASGGELSRVMLAIKVVLGEYDNISTMIFDEIDTGISGEAGKKVAQKLKMIAKNHQVLCVTHLPSIVAAGDNNYYIEKSIKNQKTTTNIYKLNEEKTIREIARIIAGNDITSSVLTHAKELRKSYTLIDNLK